MPGEAFEFEAPIAPRSFGKYEYSVVFLPPEVQRAVPFPSGKPLRIEGEVNGVPIAGALMPHEGKRYLLLSKKFLKRIRCGSGDLVHVRFSLADPNAVDVPEELRRALEANTKAGRAWSGLTPGKQRGHAYRVSSAKRAETRERRVEEVLEELLSTT